MLVFGRIFDRKTGFVAYRKKDFDILVDHHAGDQCGTRMCIASDMYRRYLPLWKLEGPVRVLDLGANGGGFPLMLSLAGIQLNLAVCVEMNPLTYRRLEVNMATNFGGRVVAINAAVCAMHQETELLIKPTRGGTGDSLIDNKVESDSAQVPVQTTTIQALYDRYFKSGFVDLCKIDIEGEEFGVFAAASDDLLLRIRYLVMEIHYYRVGGLAKAKDLLGRLGALGFVEITIDDQERKSSALAARVQAFRGPGAA
jgi:FkbM family methyltransferase